MTYNLNIQNSLKYQLFITDKIIKFIDLFDFKSSDGRYLLWDIYKYNLDGTFTLIARKKITLFTNIIQNTFEKDISPDEQYTLKNTIYWIRGLQGNISINPVTCKYDTGPLNKIDNCNNQTDERICNNSYQESGNNKLRCSFNIINNTCNIDENNIVTEIVDDSSVYCSQYTICENYKTAFQNKNELKNAISLYFNGTPKEYNDITNKYGNIKDWNTSLITDMSNIFENLVDFDEPINNWNTSNVINMSYMFSGCTNFNQTLNWDTTKVINMSYMFNKCKKFNQPINFNTPNVTDISFMFSQCTNFNESINWNTSNLINMKSLFYSCESFNQPLNWNTSNVTNMSLLFAGCKIFNQPLNNWNTSSVTDMSYMFGGCSNFNQPLNNWNTSKVTNMNYMFLNTSKYNQNISNWNTCKTLNYSSFTNINSWPQDRQPSFDKVNC